MVADVLATQGARASATMIFTMLNRINSVSAGKRLINKLFHERCKYLHYYFRVWDGNWN